MSAADPARVTHPAVRAARRLRRRRRRAETGLLLAEGPNAVSAAVDHLTQVFVAPAPTPRAAEALGHCRRAGVPELTVDERALEALADAQTPQGIVGVARWQRRTLADLHDASLLLVLDRVADPGNLGTVVRTADAAGADAVVLTRGSADPTNAKAVRASVGSLFHLPVVDDVTPDALGAHARAAGIRLVAADAHAARRYDDVPCDIPIAIVFGSEAHGLSPQMQRHIETSVSVPIARSKRPGYRGHAESLNLATTSAVIAFEIARRRGLPDRPQE
ncbi:MAG: RNA methyltransferase [Actinobacteria bacterium]|nr:RNA methyltransferase [Actinomycetota bacterium]